jgi:hypothetical protein
MGKYSYSRVEYKAYWQWSVSWAKIHKQSVQNRLVNNWLIPFPVPIPTSVVEKQFIITLIIGHVDNHTFRSLHP